MAAETLAGIPSILYGIFGMLFFVQLFGWGTSVLSGALTMALMILPLVMRTTEEALKAVPDSFREGSFALGAGKLLSLIHIWSSYDLSEYHPTDRKNAPGGT